MDRGLQRRREGRTYERGPERNSPGSMPGIEAALSEVATSNTVIAFVRTADLAMKTAALNMPDTGKAHPNWPRRLRAAVPSHFALPLHMRLVLILTLERTCFTKYLSPGSKFDV